MQTGYLFYTGGDALMMNLRTIENPCDLRKHGVCTFMLETLTLPMMGTPSVCNYFCPRLDGPTSPRFNGEGRAFLKAMIRRGTGLLFRKVIDRGPCFYRLPDLTENIWRQLREVADLYQCKLYLAGSAICDGIEPSDLDVVLGFDDIDDRAVSTVVNLADKRPTIDGIKMDWCCRRNDLPPLFPQIDVEGMRLIGSVWFFMDGSEVADDLDIEIDDHPLDYLMPELLAEMQDCGCTGGES
jgi:hypothetical protein